MNESEKRQRKIDRTIERYKALRIGKCIADTAKQFQLMIRLEAADEFGRVTCCSCGGSFELGKNVDAGHFLGRQNNATIFDERNVAPQCHQCNRFDTSGQARVNYNAYMLEKYGDQVVAELILKSNQSKQFTREELAEMRQGYMDRIREAKKKFQ